MRIDDIMAEWEKDATIDKVDLDTESLKITNIHAKWLKILSGERQKLRALEIKKKSLNNTLHEYYSGDLNNPEDLVIIKREPWGKKVLRGDIPGYIDADKDMIDTNLRISYQSETVDVCSEILKSINGRQWNIRGAIDWRKLVNFGQ